VVAADFNGDGVLDLAVTNSGDDTVGILLGQGDGGFSAQVTFPLGGTGATAAGPQPATMAVGDFNGDGQPDLVVAADNSNYVWVLLGTGTGSFSSAATFTVGNIPDGLAVADFNGDGKADFAVANYGDDTVSVLLNQGGGGFALEGVYPVGTSPWTLGVGDFNGDGLPDLAVTNSDPESTGVYTVSVLLNLGAGAFAAQVTYVVGECPEGLAVSDFTGDGKLDIAVVNTCDGTLGLLVNQGSGLFVYRSLLQAGAHPWALAAADFSGDGLPDLAVTDAQAGSVSLLINQGDGGFAAPTLSAVGTFPQFITAGDFNGDGRPDVAVANFKSNTVSVLLNQGNGSGVGTFALQHIVQAGDGPVFVVVGDFNEDGQPDLAVADTRAAQWNSGTSVSLLLNQGGGTFGPGAGFTVGMQPESEAVADFNGDGHLDLAVANFGGPTLGPSGTVSVLLGTGTGSFGAQTTFEVETGPQSVAVGDFNGDGHPDLAVANWNAGSGDTVSVLLGTGTGSFGAQTTFAVGAGPQTLAVADFNADGIPDIAVACNAGIPGNGDTVSVLLGTGTGTFGTQTAFAAGAGPYSVAVGDFNEDGKPDLAVTNDVVASATVSVLLGVGGGAFGAPNAFPVVSAPTSVTVGDFNRDGHLDLAVVNENALSVSVLLGDGTGSFGAQTTFAVGNGPWTVAAGDFNGDGLLDLAVVSYITGAGSTLDILLGQCQ
jgi:hypothetical protein